MSDLKRTVADIPAFSLRRLCCFTTVHKFPSEDVYRLFLVPTMISGILEYNGKVTMLYTSDGHKHNVDTTVDAVNQEINRALGATIEDTKEIKAAFLHEVEEALGDAQDYELISVPKTDKVPKKGDLN